MPKRANGEGTYRLRPDGLWEGRLSYLDPRTESRRRASVYGRTAEEVRTKLREVIARVEAGAPARDSRDTLASWMRRWRETSLEASDRKPSTKSLYGALSRKHIEPEPFGATRLDKLSPSDVEGLIVALRRKGLADSTVRQIYTVLRIALEIAVRDGRRKTNPAAEVKRPRAATSEARYLDASDVARLLDVARSSRYYPAVLLAAASGMRRGEVCGLRWADVNLSRSELRVRRTVSRIAGHLVSTEPKTDRSRRLIPLSAVVVSELRSWRKRQAAERLRAGTAWQGADTVFTTELGGVVDPRNLLRTVERAAEKAGLDDVGAHTLRHSAAVTWLEAGVHVKAVADLLGHSSISVTGDIYGHVSDTTARAAIDILTSSIDGRRARDYPNDLPQPAAVRARPS